MRRIKLTLELMTIQQIKEDNNKSYNPYEWSKKIDLYAATGPVQFYKVAKDEIYNYDRFFVSYTSKEGINFFAPFDYTSILNDGGFTTVKIDVEAGELRVFGFGPDGTKRAADTRDNRKQFATMSKYQNIIFSKDF